MNNKDEDSDNEDNENIIFKIILEEKCRQTDFDWKE